MTLRHGNACLVTSKQLQAAVEWLSGNRSACTLPTRGLRKRIGKIAVPIRNRILFSRGWRRGSPCTGQWSASPTTRNRTFLTAADPSRQEWPIGPDVSGPRASGRANGAARRADVVPPCSSGHRHGRVGPEVHATKLPPTHAPHLACFPEKRPRARLRDLGRLPQQRLLFHQKGSEPLPCLP
jgi:hypothetical protein